MKSAEEPQLPIGTGQEFWEERKKETLPAQEIKNTATWVNPAFKDTAPFKLKEGEPTNLILFLTQPKESNHGAQKAKRKLVILPELERGRSGLLGQIIFSDQDGRLYRDLNIKGVGLFEKAVENGGYTASPVRPTARDNEILGIFDYEDAVKDAAWAEELLKAGIRTYRIVAIVDLHEIVYSRGEMVSVEEAKKMHILYSDSRPVAEIRAFGTKERISHLAHPSSKRLKAALKDTKALVAQELGKDDLTFEDYAEWFAKTLGEQMARLRKAGLVHGNLFSQNITLDCRIVDLDTVKRIKEIDFSEKDPHKNEVQTYEREFDNTAEALATLLDFMRASDDIRLPRDRVTYLRYFREAYYKELKKSL